MMNQNSSVTGCDGKVISKVQRVEEISYAIFLFLLLFLSAIGNTLVCLAVVRFRHLRTLTNSFIFSLALTDLLTPFCRLLYISISYLYSKWVFGCFWCKFSSVLGVLLCASSIMHLCAISLERFIVIKWPLKHQNWVTGNRVAFVLGNIWIAALLLSLFPYFGFVDLAFNLQLLDCEISWKHNPKMALILTLFFFLFPFVIMSVTYFFIFKEVHRQSRRISAVEFQEPSHNEVRRKSFGVKIRISRVIKRELKAVKIIVVVIGVFFLLWLPFFIITSIRAYMPNKVSGAMQRLAFALAYSNSSCNWIIYSVMNKQFRDAFKVMITTCGNRLPSSLTHDSSSGAARKAFNAIRAANAMIEGAAHAKSEEQDKPTTDNDLPPENIIHQSNTSQISSVDEKHSRTRRVFIKDATEQQ